MRKQSFKSTLGFLSYHVMDLNNRAPKRKLSDKDRMEHNNYNMSSSEQHFVASFQIQTPQMRNPHTDQHYQHYDGYQGEAFFRGPAQFWHPQAYMQRPPHPGVVANRGHSQYNIGWQNENRMQHTFQETSSTHYPNNSRGRGRGKHGYQDNSWKQHHYNDRNRDRGNRLNQGGQYHGKEKSSGFHQASGSDGQSRNFSTDTANRDNNWCLERAAGINDSYLMSPQSSTLHEPQRNISTDTASRDNNWCLERATGVNDSHLMSPQPSNVDETQRKFSSDARDGDNEGNEDSAAGKDDTHHVSPQESGESERSFYSEAKARDDNENEASAGRNEYKLSVPPKASTSKETEGSKNIQSNDGKSSKINMKNKQQDSQRSCGLWLGIPLDQLKRAPSCFNESERKMMCTEKIILESRNESASTNFSNEDFVFMPYPEYERNPQKGSYSRWEIIKRALTWEIGNSLALESVIKLYNPHHWKFTVLHQYFETIDPGTGYHFFSVTLPKMQELALKLPELCPKPLPILKQRTTKKITLSQEQVACLLAHAFFCTFSKHHQPKGGQNYGNNKPKVSQVPEINFNTLYSEPTSTRKIEKLKCIINYFQRVTENMPKGKVTYKRQFKPVQKEFWFTAEEKLTNLYVSAEGTIEDVGIGMLQVDFANKFVGGGVLTNGLVQEEINFVLCPEMILSRLFTEMLTHNEVLIMTGCERFSNYKGYSNTFVFNGIYHDLTESDPLGRRYTEVVAMDALVFRDAYESQFEQNNVLRELSKAFCAFKGDERVTYLPAVCTGNWGCGAFGGDKQLKALIQLMAASKAGRDVCYLTFDDNELCNYFGQIHKILQEKHLCIKDILDMILEYGAKLYRNPSTQETLFEHLAGKVERKLDRRVISDKKSKQSSDINENRNKHNSNNENRQRFDINENRNKQSSNNENRQNSETNANRNRQSSDTNSTKNVASSEVKEKRNKESPNKNDKNKQSPHKPDPSSNSKSKKKNRNKKNK